MQYLRQFYGDRYKGIPVSQGIPFLKKKAFPGGKAHYMRLYGYVITVISVLSFFYPSNRLVYHVKVSGTPFDAGELFGYQFDLVI